MRGFSRQGVGVKVKVKSLSPVPLFETPWTAAYQAPPSVGFSRQEYCRRAPCKYPTAKISLVHRRKRKKTRGAGVRWDVGKDREAMVEEIVKGKVR